MPIVKVIGVQRVKGTDNQSGQPYDYWKLHLADSSPAYVRGAAAVQKNINTNVYDCEKIVPEQFYDLETDFSGRVIAIRPAKT